VGVAAVSPQDLARATGARLDRATEWLPYIEAAMPEFDITSPARQAAFLAQIGHESGGLHWVVELWGPTPSQARYEGRKDLGNTEPGDGFKFRGRGLIQTTGRANYAATGEALGIDLLRDPTLLALPENAARSAGWYWQSRGLNALADLGDFRRITLRINGGTNGLADRQALYTAAQAVLT
jgi:putative chitinase